MPRRSLRNSAASASASAASTKRKPAASTPVRRSKRSKLESSEGATKVTPKKSKYFEEGDEEDQVEDEPSSNSDAVAGAEESGYEDEDASADPSPSSSEEAESEEDVKPKKRGRQSKGSSVNALPSRTKGKDPWKEGTGTGYGPGTQVVIKKPKARDAGDTPYKDETIHPNTMLFLEELAANNNREWFKMHDPVYRQAWNDFCSFLEALTPKMAEADETIPELPIKDLFFRIYRDVRFSSDPTPYKAQFSAAWSRTGRKGPYAAYYVQIKPGGSFVGGGLWHPEAQPLAALRRSIDRRPERIKSVLLDAGIRKHFLGGVGNDEKKAVRAFTGQNAENALKTKPKGFDSEHKDIDLLRLRNFTIGCKLADEEVIDPKALERIAQSVACMVPFITFLNSVVMPDDPAASSSATGEEDDESDGADEEGSENTE